MSQALPTYPNDEIPLTDRHWRERWAQELTRANALERELEVLRTKLAAIAGRDSRNVDDLTDHCARQGAYIGRLLADKAALTDAFKHWERNSQQNFARADRLAEVIEHHAEAGTIDGLELREIIERCGVLCEECAGTGRVESFHDEQHGSYHTTREVVEDCPQCVSGKVLR